jgi:hypothetical protein
MALEWTVSINSVDQTGRLRLEQVNIEYVNGSPGFLECLIIDTGSPASAYRPVIGHKITVFKAGVKVFHGRIAATDEDPIVDNNIGTATKVHAIDYHRMLTKRRLTKSYGQFKHVETTPATTAKASLRFRAAEADIELESKESGKDIDGIYSIQLIDPQAANQSFSATEVTRGNYVIRLETDGSGNITTTAQDLKDWEDADSQTVFHVTFATGNDGTGILNELHQTFLTGAEDGTVEVIRESAIVTISTGNPGQVLTLYPHNLTTGDTVRLTDVQGVAPASVNDTDYAVTVVNSVAFTIPVNVTTAGTVGFVHKMTRLRTVINDVMALLTPHGFTLAMTGDGPWLMPSSFVRATLEDILTTATGVANWMYRLTPDLVLQVFEPGFYTSSFDLTAVDNNIIGSAPQRRTHENYINQIIALYGKAGEIGRVEDVFVANGTATQWNLSTEFIPVGSSVTVAFGYVIVNGVMEGISPHGETPAQPYTFDAKNSVLRHDSGAPAAGTVIRFPYTGDLQRPVTVQDAAEVTAMGGEIYEDVIEVGNVTEDEAKETGEVELAKRAVVARTSRVRTRAGFLLPGTVVEIIVADRLMSGDWLILNTSIRDSEGIEETEPTAKVAFYEYEVIEGGPQDSWIDFWKPTSAGASATSSIHAAAGGAFSGGGGGGIDGSGTAGKLAGWVDADTLGDATVDTADIDADAVTFAKMQNIASGSMLGRLPTSTPNPGDIEVIVNAEPIYMVRRVLTEAEFESLNTNPIELVAAPGADKIILPVHLAIEVDLVTIYGTSPTHSIVHNGSTTNLMANTLAFNLTATPSKKLAVTTGFTGGSNLYVYTTFDPRNKSVKLTSSANLAAGGVATAVVVLYYRIVQVT